MTLLCANGKHMAKSWICCVPKKDTWQSINLPCAFFCSVLSLWYMAKRLFARCPIKMHTVNYQTHGKLRFSGSVSQVCMWVFHLSHTFFFSIQYNADAHTYSAFICRKFAVHMAYTTIKIFCSSSWRAKLTVGMGCISWISYPCILFYWKNIIGTFTYTPVFVHDKLINEKPVFVHGVLKLALALRNQLRHVLCSLA